MIEVLSWSNTRLLGVIEDDSADVSEEELSWHRVSCRVHGVRPAYFVCGHLEGPEDIAYFDPADANRVGVLCCQIPFTEHALEELFVFCEGCLREGGLLPAA